MSELGVSMSKVGAARAILWLPDREEGAWSLDVHREWPVWSGKSG